jgi:hypothetical protein
MPKEKGTSQQGKDFEEREGVGCRTNVSPRGQLPVGLVEPLYRRNDAEGVSALEAT